MKTSDELNKPFPRGRKSERRHHLPSALTIGCRWARVMPRLSGRGGGLGSELGLGVAGMSQVLTWWHIVLAVVHWPRVRCDNEARRQWLGLSD